MRTSGSEQLLSIKHELMHLGDICGDLVLKASGILIKNNVVEVNKTAEEAIAAGELAHNLAALCRERLMKDRWERSGFISATIKITNEIEQIVYFSSAAAKLASEISTAASDTVSAMTADIAGTCRELINYGIDAFVRNDVISADSAEDIGYKISENSSKAISEIFAKIKTESLDEESISSLITLINLFKFICEKALCISRHALESFEIR